MGGVRVVNAFAHVELSNAASVRPGPAALALNSTGVGRGRGRRLVQSEVTANSLSLSSLALRHHAKRMKQWDLRASSCCGCNRIHQPKWDTCAPAPGNYCSDSDAGLANGFWSQHLKR